MGRGASITVGTQPAHPRPLASGGYPLYPPVEVAGRRRLIAECVPAALYARNVPPESPDVGPPSSYLVAAPGLAVVARDGSRVGTLEHVVADESVDIFEGIVIRIADDGDPHRFVARDDVAEFHDRAVLLSIGPEAIAGLHRPTPEPAAIEPPIPRAHARPAAPRLGSPVRQVTPALEGSQPTHPAPLATRLRSRAGRARAGSEAIESLALRALTRGRPRPHPPGGAVGSADTGAPRR